MNAVEIEEAVSDLAGAPFDPHGFAYAFLTAFGVKDTTIARLKKGDTNASDVGGVLQRGNIHIGVAVPGGVTATLRALRDSPKTASAKAKFILATDGDTLEAEDLISGEPLACAYPAFADQFGFFLPLAGISTVKELKSNPIDVKATGRLNRLYVELLKENEQWGTPERRHDLNQFMARLIFCFFAEDTGIFNGTNLFTSTIEQMSTTEAGSVEHVLTELFRAMDTKPEDRAGAKLRAWADKFPWVNGGLFAGGKPCPKFSRVARSYLLRAGELNWREINPDIFGSMIQAVADEGERGSLGMHYTSVPNIMKVLGPLFLDDLHAQLDAAGDNVRKLRNLRKRLASIRVFDPACGSGNFLVIAYIRMREIEHEIVKLTDDEPKSVIPLANFYGIEIKDFAAEIARLALLIAEFQCDVRFISQQVARTLVLPLKKTGQIKTGNALRENWLEVCPPAVPCYEEHDLGGPTGKLALITDGNIVDIETYICGNPPYVGTRNQSREQKSELLSVFSGALKNSSQLDYVFGWIEKASDYVLAAGGIFAFVTTNSIAQGQQVSTYWPHISGKGFEIIFAHTSFKWTNNASNNAGVTCVVQCFGLASKNKRIFTGETEYVVNEIGPYLTASKPLVVQARSEPLSLLSRMNYGNYPGDGNYLTVFNDEKISVVNKNPEVSSLIHPLYGAQEFIKGLSRFCIWIDDDQLDVAMRSDFIRDRIEKVRNTRIESIDPSYNKLAARPHQYRDRNKAKDITILAPTVSSERRYYLPTACFKGNVITTNQCFALYDAPLWSLSLLASRMHIIWVMTVCGKMKTDMRYSNTLGWNTFPVPVFTEQNRSDLTKCAEEILLAREEHFPATIADLYNPEIMPENLRQAHEKNDETLERIYIGRRFRNDTERLEKLFELYTKMTAAESKPAGRKPAGRGRGRPAAGAA